MVLHMPGSVRKSMASLRREQNRRRQLIAARDALPPSVARAIAWEIDPVLFARDCGLTPDAEQMQLLRSNAPQLALLCTRQWGKSTFTANIALRVALLVAGADVLVFARAQRQAIELLRKVTAQLGTLGASAPATLTVDNAQSAEFSNESRIVTLPGADATVRGFSDPALIIFDEAARVDDALYHAARPMRAVSNGRLIALTSAWASFGWFHHEWTEGGPGWERIEVRASQCKRFSAEFLAAERASLPARVYAREYECQFGDVEECVFARDLVDDAFNNQLQPIFPGGVFAP